jgi:hypothetical protein
VTLRRRRAAERQRSGPQPSPPAPRYLLGFTPNRWRKHLRK